jgi:hypothetical protein
MLGRSQANLAGPIVFIELFTSANGTILWDNSPTSEATFAADPLVMSFVT